MENQINVEVCTSAINQINTQISMMANVLESLQSDASNINSAWESENASAFKGKVEIIINNLNDLKTSIMNINNAVERTKDAIVKVDATANN